MTNVILRFELKEIAIVGVQSLDILALEIQCQGVDVVLHELEQAEMNLSDVQNDTGFRLILTSGSISIAAIALRYAEFRFQEDNWIRLEPTNSETDTGLMKVLLHINIEQQSSEEGCPYVYGRKQITEQQIKLLREFPERQTNTYDHSARITFEYDKNIKLNQTKIQNADAIDYALMDNLTPQMLVLVAYQLSNQYKQQESYLREQQNSLMQLIPSADKRYQHGVSIQNTTFQIKNEGLNSIKHVDQKRAELYEIWQNAIAKRTHAKSLEREIDEIRMEINEVKLRNLQIISKKTSISDRFYLLTNQQHKLEKSENLRKAFEEKYDEMHDKLLQYSLALKESIRQTIHNSSRLKQNIEQIEAFQKQILLENRELTKKLYEVKQQLTGYKYIVNPQALSYTDEFAGTRYMGLLQMDELIHQVRLASAASRKQFTLQLKQIRKSINDAASLQRQLYISDSRCHAAKTDVREQSSRAATMEQLCCIREDLHQLQEIINKVKIKDTKIKNDLSETLHKLSNIIQINAEGGLGLGKQADELVEQIEDQDYQADQQRMVADSARRRNPMYIPVKTDQVDIALAEYLNAKQQYSVVQFTREDEGQYIFGTQRVFLKLENGFIQSKLQAVKTSGGYKFIDEFLDLYTPEELLKLEEVTKKESEDHRQILERFQSFEMSPTRANRVLMPKQSIVSLQHSQSSPEKLTPRKPQLTGKSPKKVVKKKPSNSPSRDLVNRRRRVER